MRRREPDARGQCFVPVANERDCIYNGRYSSVELGCSGVSYARIASSDYPLTQRAFSSFDSSRSSDTVGRPAGVAGAIQLRAKSPDAAGHPGRDRHRLAGQSRARPYRRRIAGLRRAQQAAEHLVVRVRRYRGQRRGRQAAPRTGNERLLQRRGHAAAADPAYRAAHGCSQHYRGQPAACTRPDARSLAHAAAEYAGGCIPAREHATPATGIYQRPRPVARGGGTSHGAQSQSHRAKCPGRSE